MPAGSFVARERGRSSVEEFVEVFMVRATALALAYGAVVLAASAMSPAPAAADPRVVPAPDYVPRSGAVSRAQAYEDGDEEVRVIRPAGRVYDRRAYDDEMIEGDSRYYARETAPRRAPGVRDSVRYYQSYEEQPRRVYRDDGVRLRRYYGAREYEYESIEPEIDRIPRRYAGPPSGLGASETRRTVDPKFARATVRYSGSEPANSVVIDTRSKHLYFVRGDGTAIRYGVGVGKEGFEWKGAHPISAKREWPNWHPPAEMRARRPELPVMMAGGPDNPLGARALYLGDTLYRIHGSNEPWTIGRAVSSGCIRMTNDDVIDLYGRVGVGTMVKVM